MLNRHKVGLTVLLFTTALTANADFKNINVMNFKGHYTSPQGSGQALKFSIPKSTQSNTPLYSEIKIFKGNDNFQLSVDQQDYLWEDVPEMLLEIQSAKWSDIDFKSAAKKVSLSARSLDGVTQDKEMSLSRATASCTHTGESHTSFLDNLLESCLNGTARVRANSFNNEDKSGFLDQAALTQFIHVLQGQNDKAPSAQQELKNIKLDVKNNSFEARLKTKVVFNTTIKAKGRSYFDSSEQRVRIRIDKVKAGFLNITDKVFTKLRQMQGPKLKVEHPWVIIQTR